MSNLLIVALPAEDDYVNKLSSEKVPHLTLLLLGEDSDKVKNLDKIIEYVQHATDISLTRFGLEVDKRGTLGPEEADVLFFSKHRWSGITPVHEFRLNLLKDNNIRTAYDSTVQFPEWVPHLTLGYPTTPAKPDEREYPGINYVSFDRIAIWDKEFDGLEIPLKRYSDYEGDMALAMSGTESSIVKRVLTHHGIKGMKWGVSGGSGSSGGPQKVLIKNKGKKIKVSGGQGHPTHSDAVNARIIGQVGKKSGAKALSNEEIQKYTTRINMEQNFKRVQYTQKPVVARFIATLLGQTGKTQATNLANDVASQQVKKHLGKRIAASAATAG